MNLASSPWWSIHGAHHADADASRRVKLEEAPSVEPEEDLLEAALAQTPDDTGVALIQKEVQMQKSATSHGRTAMSVDAEGNVVGALASKHVGDIMDIAVAADGSLAWVEL